MQRYQSSKRFECSQQGCFIMDNVVYMGTDNNKQVSKVLKKGDYRSNFEKVVTSPPLTSVQVMLVPYCCLFCVLSNDMLNVSIGTFSYEIYTTSNIIQKLHPISETNNHISPMCVRSVQMWSLITFYQ